MSIDAMKQALEALGIGDPWHPTTIAAIKALNAAIEQAQEPVCDKDPQGCWNVRCQLGKVCKHVAPRQWQGLTDEEIDALMPVADGSAETNAIPVEVSPGIWGKEYDEADAWSRPLVIELTRAIEAKLKEKNS